MRRVVRWLKHLLTGRKEEHKGLEANHVAGDWSDGPEKERRWSFAKHRKSGADGGARSSVQPAAAYVAIESPQVRPKEDARAREEKAAVVIQKTFRGYLARRALRALRSLVKIQALVRGYLVRKQAAMTLHRLQTLIRLQADSIAVKNYRISVEREERIFAQGVRMKPPATPSHRRMLSDHSHQVPGTKGSRDGIEERGTPFLVDFYRAGTLAFPRSRSRNGVPGTRNAASSRVPGDYVSDSTDSNYDRSPRIVEMDTCYLGSRSSRMTSRYNPDHSSDHHRLAPPAPPCSPLPGGKLQQQPARLSFRRSGHERDHRGSKTAHSTPRFVPSSQSHDSSPAKSVEHSLAGSTPRRAAQRERDALVSPRYMAGTASSAARTRCHSAPRQRQTTAPPPAAEAPRASVTARRSCSHARGGGICFHCSEANRSAACSGISVSDEVAYLDSYW
ncbi:unnamed protein product [Urochloa humidicola]